MGITLTDVLLFGKAQLADVNKATLVIYRRNILRWSALGGYLDIIVKGIAPLSLPDAIAGSLSYVKAFGGTEQRNIPQPYTQVNYVTNTAQTAVNTGVMIDFAKNYEFEVECRAVSGSWYILQSRATTTSGTTGISGSITGGTIMLSVGDTVVCTSAISRTVGNKLYVKGTLNAGTATLYVKDETAGTEDTQTGSYDTTQPNPTAAVYLLGNAGGQYVNVNSDIYMARIKENDTVVMDYVPARQAATAGFYDKASGTFKTALTPANLSADGNTVPTPDAPMNIVSNNGVLKVRRQSGLPLGYQMVGWLKPAGTIPITGFKTKSTQEITTVFYRERSGQAYIYASDTSSSGTTNTTAYLSTGGANWRWDGKSVSISISSGIKITSVQKNDGVWLNGTRYGTYTNAEDFVSTNDLRLSSSENTTIRIESQTIREGETVTLDLVPVQRLSDNTYGFYDKVSGNFYTDAEATIVAGAVIADPIEIYADGTVETIWAHGKNLFDISTVTNGYYISATGEIVANANSMYSDYIKVKPSTTYTISLIAGSQSNVVRVHSYTSNKTWIEQLSDASTGGAGTNYSATFTTSSNAEYIRIGCRQIHTNIQIERGSTATEYAPYYDGGTATAEMLLKVGDYTDEQEIISGVVTRKVGIRVLDGTENWVASGNLFYAGIATDALEDTHGCYCTHFKGVTTNASAGYNNEIKVGTNATQTINWTRVQIYPVVGTYSNVTAFKQYLAAQYAAGTPVIIIYPLATPTTESVAGQTLQVTDGDNILEITQASLDDLELEAQYSAAVQLTIQEVQDANLDNNVTVTIQ